MKRIVILGGGFGGLYAAVELDRILKRRKDLEVILVNRENFFLFTPMLHEVAASDLDLTTIVSPLRKLLKRVTLFTGMCEAVDLERQTVRLWHGDDQHPHEIEFDHVILGLGSTTNFFSLPGLAENALTMKSLGDAIRLRNRVIANLEEADFECCAPLRRRLLTVVVAGGGFAGVETAAALHDFAHAALPHYNNLTADQLRVVIVHSGKTILPELGAKLGDYAARKLTQRGVEILTGVRVTAYEDGLVHLSDGSAIESHTLVWTAGTAPNPLVHTLPCSMERGRVCVTESLQANGWDNVWAVGDCALVPDPSTGEYHPPTAQHAIRQGKVCARNVVAAIDGKTAKPFRFRSLGQLASLGRRTGVANIMGINFSGFFAWWLWRTIYLLKLPRFEKKVRAAIDWTLDLFFSKDIVQFQTSLAPTFSTSRPPGVINGDACDLPVVHAPRPDEERGAMVLDRS
ncbi:MAG TPA: NAD(P)/FAD-dependent oxidoreductase [Pirellulaceae bacterium]|nr:NAD(P)/FAD-dependent oxidoreductase [Pirellulaceae bacterium]